MSHDWSGWDQKVCWALGWLNPFDRSIQTGGLLSMTLRIFLKRLLSVPTSRCQILCLRQMVILSRDEAMVSIPVAPWLCSDCDDLWWLVMWHVLFLAASSKWSASPLLSDSLWLSVEIETSESVAVWQLSRQTQPSCHQGSGFWSSATFEALRNGQWIAYAEVQTQHPGSAEQTHSRSVFWGFSSVPQPKLCHLSLHNTYFSSIIKKLGLLFGW